MKGSTGLGFDVQLTCGLEPGNFGGVAFTEGGVEEAVAQFHLEFPVGNPLPETEGRSGSIYASGGGGGNPSPERSGEPLEEMQLSHRFVVDGVIDLAGASVLESGQDAAGHVLTVDHVEKAVAASLETGLVAQELLEPVATARPVDAGHAKNDGREPALLGGIQQELLSLDQDTGSRAGRFSEAGFLDDGTVVLGIDAGAAGVNELAGWEVGQGIDQAAVGLGVGLLVIQLRGPGGGERVDHPVEGTGQRLQIGKAGHVSNQRTKASGPEFIGRGRGAAEAIDFVPLPHQVLAERQADVAAARNQDAHGVIEALGGGDRKRGMKRPVERLEKSALTAAEGGGLLLAGIIETMSDPTQPLKDLKPRKEFFIGIDSDGCVFDTMEIKHKECFTPMYIKHFSLQPVSKYAREVWDFVNLYSKTRGVNRFPALVRALNLLRERPEVVARQVAVPGTGPVEEWIGRETKLGNATLKKEVEGGNKALVGVYAWSVAVNKAIEEMVYGVPPFPLFRESLERMAQKADVIVVSQTPTEALVREWAEHGLDHQVRFIAGQELGTKTEHIRFAAGGKYDPGKMLMIGDAPGDFNAARKNSALFYPIVPGHEETAWERFHEEALDRFFAGSYAGPYEAKLVEEFEASLPEHPHWRHG
jgi:phosphoglycolate phosphatase-like HAD superfamily hydrolase